MQNKTPFEIILHVGRVTSLRICVAKKSCHGQTLINECSISVDLYNAGTRSAGQQFYMTRRTLGLLPNHQ